MLCAVKKNHSEPRTESECMGWAGERVGVLREAFSDLNKYEWVQATKGRAFELEEQ